MQLSAGSLVALLLVGVGAGWLGAVVGIGGGIVIVPVLVPGLDFDIRVAVATSLVAVVAVDGGERAYVGEGRANMRLEA
ncbi:MAG: TSUP family transporter [Acidimicrobiales bacterium]